MAGLVQRDGNLVNNLGTRMDVENRSSDTGAVPNVQRELSGSGSGLLLTSDFLDKHDTVRTRPRNLLQSRHQPGTGGPAVVVESGGPLVPGPQTGTQSPFPK